VIGKATVEGGKACVFYGPDVPVGTNPDVAVADSVRVVLVVGPDATKWFNNYRHKVHAKTIAGLGDKAFYDGYASISVLKGDAYVRIAVGIANNLGPEEMLARDALPRM
jgi:lipopolysaccharide export system protein LptA